MSFLQKLLKIMLWGYGNEDRQQHKESHQKANYGRYGKRLMKVEFAAVFERDLLAANDKIVYSALKRLKVPGI